MRPPHHQAAVAFFMLTVVHHIYVMSYLGFSALDSLYISFLCVKKWLILSFDSSSDVFFTSTYSVISSYFYELV